MEGVPWEDPIRTTVLPQRCDWQVTPSRKEATEERQPLAEFSRWLRVDAVSHRLPSPFLLRCWMLHTCWAFVCHLTFESSQAYLSILLLNPNYFWVFSQIIHSGTLLISLAFSFFSKHHRSQSPAGSTSCSLFLCCGISGFLPASQVLLGSYLELTIKAFLHPWLPEGKVVQSGTCRYILFSGGRKTMF